MNEGMCTRKDDRVSALLGHVELFSQRKAMDAAEREPVARSAAARVPGWRT